MQKRKLALVLVALCVVCVLLYARLNLDVPEFFQDSKPKHLHVVFLKTHKTAGSTIQNILFRFAERHKLTVALPNKVCDSHQFCYPARFTAGAVDPGTLPAQIVTNHMRFNKKELQRLMPNGTVYLTAMRETGSMFEALFTYYSRHCASFSRVADGSLRTFLDDTSLYYRPGEADSMYARNCLTFDLGGDKDRSDVAYARSFAAQVEKDFDLVMISEYFDESLVLLRRLLNWDLEDVVYFKSNVRAQGSRKEVTPELSAKIRAWNSVDAHLYEHFNASLWRRLSALGLDFVAEEVRLLRRARERRAEACFGGRTPFLRLPAQIQDEALKPWQPSGKVAVVGYELAPNVSEEARATCTKLITPELQYTAALQRAQALARKQRRHDLEDWPEVLGQF